VPWHCPACNTIIRHSVIEERPQEGERYRCHVCRLTLDFDGTANRLVITEREIDHNVAREPAHGGRTFPTPVSGKTPLPKQRKRKATKPRHK
jgi:hypothetical protein